LLLNNNRLGTKEAGKALGEMLKVNSVLKELDLSDNAVSVHDGGDGPGFAQELALGIKDNGAMTKFDISSNDIRAVGGKALAAGLKGNQVFTELNISSNRLGQNSDYDSDTSGVIALADAIPDMGALSSVNVLSNVIPVEQAQELVKIMRSKDTLTTLCGLTGVETELDFSSQLLGAGDAVLITNDISDTRALSSLNLASNCLCGLDKYGTGTFDASGNACFHCHT
jgi:hypothetical protein